MGFDLSGAASGASAGSAFGPWGAAIGGIAGALLGGSQKAPKVITPERIDPGKVAQDTLATNQALLPGASRLASGVNSFNQGEANRLIEQAIPGFSRLRDKLLSSVESDLNANGLPQDTQDQIARFAAERGVTRGTAGSGFNNFNLVKDFGYNLVDYKNAMRARALNTLSTVYGMTPRVNPMSPMASFLDNGTAIGANAQNNQLGFNAAQAGANAQAAAGNANRAMWSNTLMAASGFLTQQKLTSTPKTGGATGRDGDGYTNP